MAARNGALAAPGAHPDAQRYPARDVSTLAAGNDAGLSPRFVVVSSISGDFKKRVRVYVSGVAPPARSISYRGSDGALWMHSHRASRYQRNQELVSACRTLKSQSSRHPPMPETISRTNYQP